MPGLTKPDAFSRVVKGHADSCFDGMHVKTDKP